METAIKCPVCGKPATVEENETDKTIYCFSCDFMGGDPSQEIHVL